MEQKKFTADEVDRSFCATGWSPDESECMAVNPAPDGKSVIISALEKTSDFYTVAAEIPLGIPANAHFEFMGKEHVGEVFCEEYPIGVRYDYIARQAVFVHWGMWMNNEGIHPDPEREVQLPSTPSEVCERFFPHDKPACDSGGIEWMEFTVRNRKNFWRAVDDADSEASFVVETADGGCAVYACRRDRDPMIVSTFVLPQSVAFPLKFKINFDQGVGVFSINEEQLIGSYDFNAFMGEALFLPR